MRVRHSQAQVERWRTDGCVVLPGFFSPEEIAPLQQDFDTLYLDRRKEEAAGQPLDLKKPGRIGDFHRDQFVNYDILPYQASVDINLISMHPALMAFAKDLLGRDQLHLYQSHTLAKFSGSADYDQPFHCDYGNHTLTVPADDVAARTAAFIIYVTDVTEALGAFNYVIKPDSDRLLGSGELVVPGRLQKPLMACARAATGPAGTLVAYAIDTVHRGTNLTSPNGKRYSITVGYKARGNEMIGFHVWQFNPGNPWHLVLNHASPEQLEMLGIPLPGDPFWTERTLRLTQERWPDWEMQPYFSASCSV